MAASACAGVQTRSVSGARFEPYTNLWNWAFVGADGTVKPQGTWSERLEIESAGGRRVGRRTQEQRLPDGRKVVTINVFDLETLAPLERDWRVFDGRYNHLQFRGREVEQHMIRTPGGEEETARFVVPEEFFDFNGGMYGLLLRAFPLREGFEGTFTAIAEDSQQLQHLKVVVRGRETVPGHGGAPVSAWRVEVPESDYGRMTFWLSDEPPYIIRLTFPQGNGIIAYEMA
jgi:hypothetical protein